MEVKPYANPADFLQAVQADLEQDEIANSLILGLSLQLGRAPERILTPTYLRCVMDTDGLALAALMTPPNNLILYGRPDSDPRSAIRLLAADLARLNRAIPGVLAPAEISLPFAECWAEVARVPVKATYHQELMALREVQVPPPGQGSLRAAMPADLNLVAHWRHAFHREVFGKGSLIHDRREMAHRIKDGDIFLWEDAGPVSLAMRTRPTRSGVSIGSVYTPPDMRRKGYGSACVAELSRLLLGSGWQVCCLFVDLENPIARRIYHNTGYRPACEYTEYVFGT
jgi:predicted GNAT family acetyltransferase